MRSFFYMYIYYLCKKGDFDNPRYVGQTIKPLKVRLSCHKWSAKNSPHRTLVNNWMRSINCEIDIILLEECNSLKELYQKEIWWISYFKLFFNLKNMNPGGMGANVLIGENNPSATPVLQYDLNGNFIAEYKTLKEASEKTNTKMTKISNCVCLERVKSGGGYQWVYKKDNNYKLKIDPIIKKDYTYSNEKAVLQFDTNGNFIKEWENRGDAARALGFDRANILKALKNNLITYDYFWFYKNNFQIDSYINQLRKLTVIEVFDIVSNQKTIFNSKIKASLFLGYKYGTGILPYINNQKICKVNFLIKEYQKFNHDNLEAIREHFKNKKII